ncbi:MAG: hypothetical protein KGD60_08880 [Candidatus Thorarchaeota archaeon]|nr:hypothetical protein [Candidatus Thorarchaeota archaeon]
MIDTGFAQLARLERTGALRLLVALLDGPLFISQLIKRHDNLGIASQPAIEKTRTVLVELGLSEEYEKYMELTQKTRLYLRLTKKGRVVAKSLRRVAQSLAES